MLLRSSRFGASDHIKQLIEEGPLTLQQFRPRLWHPEPPNPVDLRVLPELARPLRPLQREGVADRAVQIQLAPDGERGDNLAARLLQRRKVDARAVGRLFAQFLGELTL